MIYLFLCAALFLHMMIMFTNQFYFETLLTLFIFILVIKLKFYKQPLKYTSSSSKPICIVCKKFKPPRFYHCRQCKICIYRMDHHCPWIDNCVGFFNAKLYLHLLIYTLILSFLYFIRIFFNFDQIFIERTKIWITVSFIPMLYSLYQAQRLLKEFYQSVRGNQTLVESYKEVNGKQQTIRQNLTQIFGDELNIKWFLPLFANHKQLNLTQRVISKSNNIKELIYADQYIDGQDEQDKLFKNSQEQY